MSCILLLHEITNYTNCMTFVVYKSKKKAYKQVIKNIS